MGRDAVESLIDRWLNDPGFREELRRDPEEAVRRSGVELDADEWAALRGIDWSFSDEELQLRANKYWS
jgi:hypothetical protein